MSTPENTMTDTSNQPVNAPMPAAAPAPVDNAADDPLIADMLQAQNEVATLANSAAPAPAAPTAPAQPTDPAADLAVVTPKTTEPAATPAPEAEPSSPMIPKARLDDVLSKLEAANAAAAYYKGVADTRATATAPSAPNEPAAPAAPSYEETINTLEAQKLELSDKYENGDITMRQLEEQRIAIDRQIRAKADERQQELINQAKNTGANAARLEAMKVQVDQYGKDLAAKHPFIGEIDAHPNRVNIWNFIDGEAQRGLMARGMNPADAHGNLAVRMALMNEKAALVDKFGPTLTGKAATTPTTTTQPATGQADPASQRLAKLELAGNQPPAVSGIGAPGVAHEVTEADIMKMTDDELAALPESTRRRFMGT